MHLSRRRRGTVGSLSPWWHGPRRTPRARTSRGRAVRLATRHAKYSSETQKRTFAHLPHPLYVASFLGFRTRARFLPNRTRAAAQITRQPPSILGLSNGEMPSMCTKLVAFPLVIWVRAPLELMIVQHGRGIQSVPADDSTSQERAARAKDRNHAQARCHASDHLSAV